MSVPTPRPCVCCHAIKPVENFPRGRSGWRPSTVCWLCTEERAYAVDAWRTRTRTTFTNDKGQRVRRCGKCSEVKTLTRGFYVDARDERGRPVRWMYYCKRCQIEGANRRYYESRKDPQQVAKLRARNARLNREWRRRNPAAARAAVRRHHRKVQADPQKHAAHLESRRMARRLKREREGKPVRPLSAKQRANLAMTKTASSYLPAGPLAALVDRIVDQRKAVSEVLGDRARASGGDGVIAEVCAEFGVDERTYRGWRTGEYRQVRIGMAEKVLLRAGVEWFEIYSYDDHAATFLAEPVRA